MVRHHDIEIMTEAEVWKFRYEVLKSAVVGVCAAAEVGSKKMGGKECIDLIAMATKKIEDGGGMADVD